MDAAGRFAIEGLVPGTYDLVVAEQGLVQAISSRVAAGLRDIQVRMPNRVLLRGEVKGIPATKEASIEVWCASRGIPLADLDTVHGHFSLEVPQGVQCSIFAQYEGQVALLESVVPTGQPIVLNLKPSATLRARIDGASGPVLAMVRRTGFRRSLWVEGGADLQLGFVVNGAYQVQLLPFAQAQTHLFAMSGVLIPPDESWPEAVSVRTGDADQRIRGP